MATTSYIRHHQHDKAKVTVTRLGYQHGAGAGSLRPQIHDATTELGNKIEEMIVSDRIVDPLCVFCDERVRLVSEFGAHYESAGISRQFHEFVFDVQEGPGGESSALDHDRVEGGSADKSDKT